MTGPLRLEASLSASADSAADLLHSEQTILVRNALDVDVMRAFGKRYAAGYGPYFERILAIENTGKRRRYIAEQFRVQHAEAGLPPYALVKAFARSPMLEILRCYFGTDKVLASWDLLIHAGLRPAGDEGAYPFHQDGGRFNAIPVRAWVLLYPEVAGEQAPSMQLLPTPKTAGTMLPIATGPTRIGIDTDAAALAPLLAEQQPWTPVIRLGDALLFSGDCLHATYQPAGAFQDRWALQATFHRATPEALEAATTDYCLFTRDSVLIPTDDTVEGWDGGGVAIPASAAAPGAGFERIPIT